jgi:hypothetical protein
MSNDPYSDCLELFNEEKDKKSCKARLDLYYHLFYIISFVKTIFI